MDVQQTTAHVKRSRDEASKRLGEKMLQGWTMLGASCPTEDCYTPLMRNKQEKMFCVRCDQFVISEEEAKIQAEKKAIELSAVAKEEAEKETHHEDERTRRIKQQFHLEEQARQAEELLKLEETNNYQVIEMDKAAKKTNTPVSSGSDVEVNMFRRQTLATLYQKMGVLTESLSPNDHRERLVAVTKAVREIAEAAHLLK